MCSYLLDYVRLGLIDHARGLPINILAITSEIKDDLCKPHSSTIIVTNFFTV